MRNRFGEGLIDKVECQILNQKVFFPHFLIVPELLNAPMITDLAVIDDITPVTYSQGGSHMLLSKEDR